MDGDATQRMVVVLDVKSAVAWLTKQCAPYEQSRVLVTSDVAERWLTKNTRNRKPTASRIEEWARLMAAGRWIAEADTIDFGADGTLYNGQHRLMAVVKNKQPVEMFVRRNCPEELLGAVDNNEARTAAQIVKIERGIETSKGIRAAVACAFALVRVGQIHAIPRQTRDGLLDALAEFGDDYRSVYDAIGHENGRLNYSGMIGSLIIVQRTHPTITGQFAREVRAGTDLKKGSPVLALRDYLLGARGVGGGMQRDEVSRVTFGAFDAYLKGESRQFIRSTSSTARERHIEAWKKANAK